MYQYIMIDGYGEADESVHLRFGIELHTAMQEYAIEKAEGAGHEDALRIVVSNLLARTVDYAPDPLTKAGKYKSRSNLLMAVIDYLDKYVTDGVETYVMENGKPAVELSFRFELPWGPQKATLNEDNAPIGEDIGAVTQPYLLSGHLDRVVSFSGDLFVLDYKTTMSTPGPYFFDGFAPSNQMTLYTLASKVILNSPIKGVIIEAIQLMVDSSRSVRGFTYRTPDQLEEWTADLHYWLSLSEQFATANYWPMNDTSCDKFGGCRFRKICSKSPSVREQWLKADFVQLHESQRWNPLRSR